MIFVPLPLAGSYLVKLEKIEDDRGFFARNFCAKEFHNKGLETNWKQINCSLSRKKGTVRGMHFQVPPKAEVKMVRCVIGAVWDVIVDLREGSKTFGDWYAIELNSDNKYTLYIPKGFAHGFQTLQSNTELMYFHSEHFSSAHDAGLKYNDPTVGIDWPLPVNSISDKDKKHPNLERVTPIAV